MGITLPVWNVLITFVQPIGGGCMNWKGVVVGIVAAAVATFLLSWVWYGMIMADAMAEVSKAMGMDPNDQSGAVIAGYFVAELLRSCFVAVGVTSKGTSGVAAFRVGALLGLFACAWFGLMFLYMPAYTPTIFFADVLVGGFLFCGISGWIIATVNQKLT